MLRKLALLAGLLSMALVAPVPVPAQAGYERQFDPVEDSGISTWTPTATSTVVS